MSISSLSEGSGYYTGGPDSTGGPEPRLFGLSACLFRDTRCSWTFPSRETGPGPLSGEQDSGPQGSGCLDVVKDNYKALALTQQEGVPQSWGTDNELPQHQLLQFSMLFSSILCSPESTLNLASLPLNLKL